MQGAFSEVVSMMLVCVHTMMDAEEQKKPLQNYGYECKIGFIAIR